MVNKQGTLQSYLQICYIEGFWNQNLGSVTHESYIKTQAT